jgi:Dynamin central region
MNELAAASGSLVMQVARAKEAAFFRGHPAYAGAANTGTDFLSRRLEAQLVRAIQARLPTIRSAVDNGCAYGLWAMRVLTIQ